MSDESISNQMSTTSNITHWTCQCGVQVPLGVAHRCGGQPVEVTYNLPWPTELIAAQQARIAALEAATAELREALEELHESVEHYLRQEGTTPDVLCVTEGGDSLNAAYVHAARTLAANRG